MPDIQLATPLTLPCGAVLPNRLAKGAMTEGLADPRRRAMPGFIENGPRAGSACRSQVMSWSTGAISNAPPIW